MTYEQAVEVKERYPDDNLILITDGSSGSGFKMNDEQIKGLVFISSTQDKVAQDMKNAHFLSNAFSGSRSIPFVEGQASELQIRKDQNGLVAEIKIGSTIIRPGDLITMDAHQKKLYAHVGSQDIAVSYMEAELAAITTTNQQNPDTLKLNIDTPKNIRATNCFPLSIGLTRTESYVFGDKECRETIEILEEILFKWDTEEEVLSDQELYAEFYEAHLKDCHRYFASLATKQDDHQATLRLLDLKAELYADLPSWRNRKPKENPPIAAFQARSNLNYLSRAPENADISVLREIVWYFHKHTDQVHLIGLDPNRFFCQADIAAPLAKIYNARNQTIPDDLLNFIQIDNDAQYPPQFGLRDNAQFYYYEIKAILTAAHAENYQGTVDVKIPSLRTLEDVHKAKEVYEQVIKELGDKVPRSQFGIMIENMDIRKHLEDVVPLCDFVCFGTNDYTAELHLLSRARYANKPVDYIPIEEDGIQFTHNPFVRFSPEVSLAMYSDVQRMRAVDPDLDIRCCGNQVGLSSTSARFCFDIGMNAISVPPAPNTLISAMTAIALYREDHHVPELYTPAWKQELSQHYII